MPSRSIAPRRCSICSLCSKSFRSRRSLWPNAAWESTGIRISRTQASPRPLMCTHAVETSPPSATRSERASHSRGARARPRTCPIARSRRSALRLTATVPVSFAFAWAIRTVRVALRNAWVPGRVARAFSGATLHRTRRLHPGNPRTGLPFPFCSFCSFCSFRSFCPFCFGLLGGCSGAARGLLGGFLRSRSPAGPDATRGSERQISRRPDRRRDWAAARFLAAGLDVEHREAQHESSREDAPPNVAAEPFQREPASHVDAVVRRFSSSSCGARRDRRFLSGPGACGRDDPLVSPYWPYPPIAPAPPTPRRLYRVVVGPNDLGKATLWTEGPGKDRVIDVRVRLKNETSAPMTLDVSKSRLAITTRGGETVVVPTPAKDGAGSSVAPASSSAVPARL